MDRKIIYFTYYFQDGAAIHIQEFVNSFKKINPAFQWVRLGVAQTENSTMKYGSGKTEQPSLISKFLHSPKKILLNLKYLLQELWIVHSKRPDLILARMEVYGFSAILTGKISKIPVILEINSPLSLEFKKWNQEFVQFHWLARIIERFIYRSASAIIVVSGALKDWLIRDFGIPPEQIFVNPNGADPAKFVSFEHGKLPGETMDKIVIGFIGSFQKWHGIQDLLLAFQTLDKKYMNIRLLLIGSGPMLKESMVFVEKAHLTNKVSFIPQIAHHEVPQYLAKFDIAVVPAANLYMSPIKVFEYMLMEKSVVAPDNETLREIIQSEINGLLFEGGANRLSGAIGRLVEDADLREKLGRNAKVTILKKFTWDENAKRVSIICDKVIESIRK